MATADFRRQLEGFGLTTANILYRMPDHPGHSAELHLAAARPASAFPRAQEIPRLLDARARRPAPLGDGGAFAPHQAGGIQGGRRGIPAELICSPVCARFGSSRAEGLLARGDVAKSSSVSLGRRKRRMTLICARKLPLPPLSFLESDAGRFQKTPPRRFGLSFARRRCGSSPVFARTRLDRLKHQRRGTLRLEQRVDGWNWSSVSSSARASSVSPSRGRSLGPGGK